MYQHNKALTNVTRVILTIIQQWVQGVTPYKSGQHTCSYHNNTSSDRTNRCEAFFQRNDGYISKWKASAAAQVWMTA